MKMSLLHALAALLTVLMLVVRQRHALAAVCSVGCVYMKMSLLHALAALLTVLMLVVRQRHALAAVCSVGCVYMEMSLLHALAALLLLLMSALTSSVKPRKLKLETQLQSKYCDKPAIRSCKLMHCAQQTSFFQRPKYKRDPEINIDNEQIGHRPCED
ncbi:unnamed protein product [Colias eurytheme]|nr:unnamed protein product [Colias eurytheme]